MRSGRWGQGEVYQYVESALGHRAGHVSARLRRPHLFGFNFLLFSTQAGLQMLS